MQGWVKFHRRITKWEWYTDKNTFKIFFHLILMANHKSKKWRGIEVNRGELITSQDKLAATNGITRQQVRTSLNKLKSTNEITIKTTNKYTLIKVVNYSNYQEKEKESNQQNNQQITNEQPTSNQPDNQRVTTNKNVKNLKNVKNVKNVKNKEVPIVDVDFKKNKIPYEKIVDLYNDILGDLIPAVRKLTKTRKTNIKVRWKENLDSLEKWEELFTAVEEQDFMLGDNKNNWNATFDWLIKNSNNYVKALERQYESGNTKKTKKQEKRRMDKLYGGFLKDE